MAVGQATHPSHVIMHWTGAGQRVDDEVQLGPHQHPPHPGFNYALQTQGTNSTF
jgi:hypothetical protein